MAACLPRYWWDAFGCAARAPYLRSAALARSASLRSHALSRAIPKDILFRWFSPLARLRERGGGEGRGIHEVNRITVFEAENLFRTVRRDSHRGRGSSNALASHQPHPRNLRRRPEALRRPPIAGAAADIDP
ncbi:hypothetical protein CBM2634_A250060 [Cupriavidus taiwanensis]|uniref:Uncharacterized protein n=1 Tax=Cupriavidus taiwanensis TaxID=164546 RepID=A0A375IZM4_9BURK|nr:hypothetical protein CBM2634_A250060 [Cupriavidus taiwanensis]